MRSECYQICIEIEILFCWHSDSIELSLRSNTRRLLEIKNCVLRSLQAAVRKIYCAINLKKNAPQRSAFCTNEGVRAHDWSCIGYSPLFVQVMLSPVFSSYQTTRSMLALQTHSWSDALIAAVLPCRASGVNTTAKCEDGARTDSY